MISEIDIKDWDHCEIKLVRENEDGSADYQLNVGPLATKYLLSYAFISVLKRAIEEGKTLTPPEEDKPLTPPEAE